MHRSILPARAIKFAVSTAIGLLMAIAAAKPVGQHGYTTGRFALELDGVVVGWVTGVEGGSLKSDVVSEKLGDDNVLKKHIGNISYQEISLRCGTGMSKQLYDWIKAECAGTYTRHIGAIVATDFNLKPIQRMEFTGGVLSEISFPALDAASKDAAYMTLHISPEKVARKDVQGQAALPPPVTTHKAWTHANFRLNLHGLDCMKVNKIEGLTIKRKVMDATGTLQDYPKSSSLQEPNLVITLPTTDSDPFTKWHEDFVINGAKSSQSVKSGQLDFLDVTLQGILFSLNFHDLGIFKISEEKSENPNDKIKRVKVEMYTERIDFDFGSNAWASRQIKGHPGA